MIQISEYLDRPPWDEYLYYQGLDCFPLNISHQEALKEIFPLNISPPAFLHFFT